MRALHPRDDWKQPAHRYRVPCTLARPRSQEGRPSGCYATERRNTNSRQTQAVCVQSLHFQFEARANPDHPLVIFPLHFGNSLQIRNGPKHLKRLLSSKVSTLWKNLVKLLYRFCRGTRLAKSTRRTLHEDSRFSTPMCGKQVCAHELHLPKRSCGEGAKAAPTSGLHAVPM